MVRISDGRMSGTAYGTVVLHVAPESAVGGTLALVRNGDMITLDVANRRLQLEVSEEELAQRKKEWTPPQPQADRGYTKMYIENVNQADQGCDLDFLKGGSGAVVNRDLH
jgi:dihydroxy-acid dehydratase